jgi:hypothetical protein
MDGVEVEDEISAGHESRQDRFVPSGFLGEEPDLSFNDDQLDYMRSLAAIPPAEKCYCAWFRLGECPNCPPGLSAGDRVKLECRGCGNYPPREDLGASIVHRIGCKIVPRGGVA